MFWKVRMKPGMPLLFADGGRLGAALFLGLPGNPVSVLATYLTLGRRLLDGLQGRAAAASALARTARVALAEERTNGWNSCAAACNRRTTAAARACRIPPTARTACAPRPIADALIVLDEGQREYAAGDVVDVLPY